MHDVRVAILHTVMFNITEYAYQEEEVKRFVILLNCKNIYGKRIAT
jgi:hypothetical protein